MFLEYHEGVRAYKAWCLELRFKKCMINYHVIFNEIVIAYKSKVFEFVDSRDAEKKKSIFD